MLLVTAAILTGSPPVHRLDPVFRLPDRVLTVARGADLVIVVREDLGGRPSCTRSTGDFPPADLGDQPDVGAQ